MKNTTTRSLWAAAYALTLSLAATGHAQAQSTPTTPTLPVPPHGYMVISYDIRDQAMFQKYMDAAGTLAANYKGKVTIFNMKVQGTEGKPRSVFGMVEFPTLADAQRFYGSPEYTAARKFRCAATRGTSTAILTEGLPQ